MLINFCFFSKILYIILHVNTKLIYHTNRLIMSDLSKKNRSEKKRKSVATYDSQSFSLLHHPMRIQFGIAFVLTLIAFIGYRITFAPVVLPGEPSEYLPVVADAIPRFTYKNFIWQNVLEFLFNLGGSLEFVNNVCSIISALAVGMLYLVTSSLAGLFLNGNAMGGVLHADNPNGEINVDQTIKRIQYRGSVLAGATAALCFAFCPPYWMAATMPYYHSFYILWLLISAFLVLRFGMTAKLPYLYAFCLVHSLGMTQASCFVAFAPIFYIYAAYVLLASNKFNLKGVVIPILLSIIGFSFIFIVVSSYCSSEVAIISKKTSFLLVFKEAVTSLFSGVFSNLPKTGWLLLLGTTIFPFAASIISGRRSLNGESDLWFYFLNCTIFIATLFVVFDSVAAPWAIFKFNHIGNKIYIIPYALVAMTLGYSILYLYSLSIYLFKYIPTYLNFGALIRYVSVVIAFVICAIGMSIGYSKADNTKYKFLTTFCDKLIINMGEREWLITEGFIDNVIMIRAKELDKKLYLINWYGDYSKNKVTRENLKANINETFPIKDKDGNNNFSNIRLQSTVEIGIMPLLQEWLQNQPNPDEKLAIMLFPDVWNFADMESYPCGLAFCGMKTNELLEYDLDDIVADYNDTLKKMKTELPEYKDINDISEMRRVDFIANYIRRKVSFIGNNLAYALEQQGRFDDAFKLYYDVHKFDPNNISALLNVSSLIQKYPQQFGDYEKDATQALSDFQKRYQSQEIWSISRVYGYVSRPEVFAQLGWTWALSGQNNMALKSLSRVLDSADSINTAALKKMMASINAKMNNVEASEKLYLEILAKDPNDKTALQGLISLYMGSGELKKAESKLDEALKAGVSYEVVEYYRAMMYIISGDFDNATIVVRKLLEMNPENYQAAILQIQIYHSRFENAESDEDRNNVLASIEKELDKLKEIENVDSFIVSMVEGSYKQLIKDYKGARASFLVALQQIREQARAKGSHYLNINQTPIYEEILRMDIQLNDKESARNHSIQIMHLDSQNWLANYALGSLALNEGNLVEAESYLQHSHNSNVTSLMTINDLAYTKYLLGKFDNVNKSKKLNEAIELIKKGIEVDSNFYILWDTYGSIKLEEKKYDDAEIFFKRAIKLYDGDLRPHLHLAQVYYFTQRYDNCQEVMRRLSASADSFVGYDREEYDALEQALVGLKK